MRQKARLAALRRANVCSCFWLFHWELMLRPPLSRADLAHDAAATLRVNRLAISYRRLGFVSGHSTMRAQTTRLRGEGSPAVVGWPNREWQLTADFVEKVEKSRVTKLAKLQSDGTSPLNIISDRPRTSHAAQSTNWLVPQLIF